MEIHLSADRERFVRSLVEASRFVSEEAVIEAALRLLQAQSEEAVLAELRRDIGAALAQADRGEVEPFDACATLAQMRSRSTDTS